MKVVFLDFDGVLNTNNRYIPPPEDFPVAWKHCWVDPNLRDELIEFLFGYIMPPAVVVSSTWRRFYNKDLLSKILDYPIEDITPDFGVHSDDPIAHRADEIFDWLERHTEVDDFVIFDDVNVFTGTVLQNHFVHVNPDKGLSMQDIEDAMNILGD